LGWYSGFKHRGLAVDCTASGRSAAILFCAANSRAIDIQRQLALLSDLQNLPPIVALSEPENFKRLASELLHQLRGYVPSNASLDVVVEALDIVRRGGVFLPASHLPSLNCMLQDPRMLTEGGAAFTAREYAVLGSLRQGKSNKCIAYDLNMSESTVKVHVRNIMKKVNARNRTEVAFLTQHMFRVSDDGPSYTLQQI
jgi:DNA-binding NarL/FixJ family response regulator